MWQDNPHVVHFLKAMLEHRAVYLIKDILPDFHNIVGIDCQQEGIVGGMMEAAEGKTIINPCLPQWIGIGDDMCGIQQLGMTQTAKGALGTVSGKHFFPETPLMKSHANIGSDVGPSNFRIFFYDRMAVQNSSCR